MASPYAPVETILKVDENVIINSESHKLQPSVPESSNYVSIGTQCDWKIESPEMNSCSILSVNDKKEARIVVLNQDNLLVEDKNSEEVSMVLRGWSPQMHSNPTSDQKVLVPTSFSQQFACNIQTLPFDEKFFLQFDYKTRNKLKTKQRRLDPYYRSQERVRQRTVMRIKRQDPRFRAAEREKGRYRMRIKRLDPVFRSQERERQRERMKIKRSDPGFREKEREQQKSRLHVKRLDPAFKEKERAQDRIRMHIKRQNNNLHPLMHSNKIKSNSKIEGISCTENLTLKSNDSCDTVELQCNQTAFSDNINTRILSVKPKDSIVETFHFKKQHILNFNFYNSNKEQWAVHDELCSKTIAHFNVLGAPSISEDAINLLRRDHAAISRKININTEGSSHELLDIKPSAMSFLETQKSNNVHNSDSTVLNRISLVPSSEGSTPIHEDTISHRKEPLTVMKKLDINAESNSQSLMNFKPVEMPFLQTSKEKSVSSNSSSNNRIYLISCTDSLLSHHILGVNSYGHSTVLFEN